MPGNGTAYLQFDRKALRLIIDEATQLGVHVAVHSLSTDGIAEVVEARPGRWSISPFTRTPTRRSRTTAAWWTGWWSAAFQDVR